MFAIKYTKFSRLLDLDEGIGQGDGVFDVVVEKNITGFFEMSHKGRLETSVEGIDVDGEGMVLSW